ncbi:uncharacterized protein LOC143286144 [Babylonia areolata]|uniref:uncharacterized protein LOC143286144 n=1 Tax=Babylonia areolata TaxID=304850 RepID=UPI003FD2D233
MPVANQTAFDMSVAKQREESMSPDTWTAASMSSVRHTAPRAAKTKWNTVNTQKSIQTTVCPQKSKRRACTQKPKLTEMNNLKSKQIETNTHRSKQIEMNTPGSKQIEMNTQRSEPRDASIQKAKLRTVTMQKPVQTEIKTSKSKHTKVVTPNLKGSTSESTDIKVKTPKSNLTKTRASKSDCTKASTPKSEQTKAKTPVSDQIKVKTSKSKETKAKTQKSKQISPSSATQKQMAVNTQTRILKTKGCTATVGKGYPDRHQEKQAIGGWEQTPSQRMDKVTPLPHASSGKGAGRCHTVCANTLTSSVMKNTNVMRRLHFEQGESAYRQYKTKENMPVIIEAPGNSRAIVRSSPHQCDRQGSLQAFSNASHNVDGVHSDSSASCDLDKSILNDQNWFSDSLCNFSHRAARKRHYPQADGDVSANHSAASWSKVQKVNTSTSERIQGWDANRKSSRERRPSTVMNTRTGNRTRMNTSLPVQPSVTPVHDDEAKYLSTPSPSSVLSDCNNGTHTVLERDGSVLSSDTADNETMSAKGLHVMPGSESSIHSSLSSEQGWMAADTWIGGDHVVPVLSVPDVSMAVQQDDGEVVQNMIMCQYLPCGPQDSDMPLFLHDTTLYSQPMQQTPSVNEVSILNFFFPTIAAVGDKLPTGLQTPLNGQGLCGEQPVSLNTNIGSDTFLETPGLNRISIPYQWLKLESLVPNDGQG